MEYRNKGRMARKEAVGMEELISQYIRSQLFKNGVLYCSLSSSMVRNRLYFMKDDLVKLINDRLLEDELFTPNPDGKDYVKDIVLK